MILAEINRQHLRLFETRTKALSVISERYPEAFDIRLSVLDMPADAIRMVRGELDELVVGILDHGLSNPGNLANQLGELAGVLDDVVERNPESFSVHRCPCGGSCA